MLTLNKRNYKLFDFIRLPMQASPWCTVIKIANKIMFAFIPPIQVLVTADFIDTSLRIFAKQSPQRSIYWPLFLLVLIIIYSNLNWELMSFIDLKLDKYMAKKYRSAIIEKRARLEYQHIENNETWDLISRTCREPIERLRKGFNNLLEILRICIQVISLLSILVYKVWWVGLVIIAISIPLFFLALKVGEATYEANIEVEKHKRRAEYFHTVLTGRESVEERSLFGYAQKINNKWVERYEKARKISMRVGLKWHIRMKGASIITALISVIIMAVFLIPLSKGMISIGMFIAIVIAALELIQLMSWQLSSIMSALANNKAYLKDLTMFFSLSETSGALDMPVDGSELCFESIEFINVTFKYPGTEEYILKNFNLRIEKDHHYAFVGVNGAGKTTITKLLTRMYDNYEGKILIDGKSIREYSQAEIKGFFSIVYQDFAKYYISLKENILLGNVAEGCTRSINEVITDIGLDDLIDTLQEGLNTWLGKIKTDGVDISGGQWQRIAIARALYNPAQVRILDEPTAALDPVAESKVYEMFDRLSTGKTTILITHRLGAAKLADEIIVIDDGKVCEQGSHDKLLKLKGLYAKMFDAQRSWYQ